jgi:GxxExxY protein
MNAENRLILDNVTSRIISCASRVSNTLGAGFLEKVYENALAVELRSRRLSFQQQPAFHVRYREEIVGEYIPDLVVAESVIVEIKALDALAGIHQAQCMNYLRATGLTVALLFNFGRPRFQMKRVVWDFR